MMYRQAQFLLACCVQAVLILRWDLTCDVDAPVSTSPCEVQFCPSTGLCANAQCQQRWHLKSAVVYSVLVKPRRIRTVDRLRCAYEPPTHPVITVVAHKQPALAIGGGIPVATCLLVENLRLDRFTLVHYGRESTNCGK